MRILSKQIAQSKSVVSDQSDLRGIAMNVNGLGKQRSRDAVNFYATFTPDGFQLVPGVEIPDQVRAAKKRFDGSSKAFLDGPTALFDSEFLVGLEERV